MAQKIINVLNDLSRSLGIPVVTPEYEIALSLLDSDGLTADQLYRESSLSRSGFFHAIDRLKHWRILVCDTYASDRRYRIYRLRETAASLILFNFVRYQKSRIEFNDLGIRKSDVVGAAERSHGGDARLPHLSCEYQILHYLYLRPASANREVARAIAVSATKFNSVLQSLARLGLVYATADDQDKRRRLYYIPDNVREIIDQARQGVLEWLASREAIVCDAALAIR